MLSRAAALSVVGRAGVGTDNIDVAAARARGVEVVYAPDANTQAVVEYVLTIVLDHLRPHPRVTGPASLDRWRTLRAQCVGDRQLGAMTVGVLGLGRIGRRLATACRALGCRVLYNDLIEIEPSARSGAEPVPVEHLFEQSDVLSIHIDGRPGNRRFVDGRLLRRLRSDALLINTSRGFVVDNAALVEVLRANPDTTALLDVHDPEPFDASYPLLGLENVRLFPHLAGATVNAHENMSWVVRDVVAVLEGRAPKHPAP
jgi:D-3-phosphoglycerate dehydrogenase